MKQIKAGKSMKELVAEGVALVRGKWGGQFITTIVCFAGIILLVISLTYWQRGDIRIVYVGALICGWLWGLATVVVLKVPQGEHERQRLAACEEELRRLRRQLNLRDWS